MKQCSILILLLISILSADNITIHNGSVNLKMLTAASDQYQAIQGTVPLYWNRFLSFEDLQSRSIPDPISLELPGVWNELNNGRDSATAIGYGTVVISVIPPMQDVPLKLKLPAIRTAYRLYQDSVFITSVGIPGISKDEAKPGYLPHTVSLRPSDKPFKLLFHISNFDNNKGGPWKKIFIGSASAIDLLRKKSLAYDLFLMGTLIFFVFISSTTYHFSETNEKRRALVALALFTFSIVVRTALTGERFLYYLFPEVPAHFFVKLEYISFFTAGIFFHLYVHYSFEKWSIPAIKNFVIYGGLLFIAMVVFTPLHIHSQVIPVFQINVFLIMMYQTIIAYRSRREEGVRSIVLLISILFLLVTAIHDILNSYTSTAISYSLAPLGNMIVVLLQTVLVSTEHASALRSRLTMAKRLQEINTTLNRFVPEKIFSLMSKTPETIEPGHQLETDLTIMVADIRNFTALSERMSPEMNFSFINRFLNAVAPYVTKHNGFINNFIGDAFVAVFTGSPVHAVRSAIDIQKELINGDLFSPYMLDESIRLGVGIHTGVTNVGIAGGNTRMENTLLGESVVVASRLEELTKETGAYILVSERVLESLPQDYYNVRYLGKDYQKFQQENIYELFIDLESPDTKRKRRTQKLVEQAVHFINYQQFDKALESLERISDDVAKHDVAIAYLKNYCTEEEDSDSTAE